MMSEAELLKPLGLKIVYHMVMASGVAVRWVTGDLTLGLTLGTLDWRSTQHGP